MTITFIRAGIIYVFVVLAVRIMGKRQLGELKPHEFVITILISAVATIPLEDNTIPLFNSLLPILMFISLEIIESALAMKSIRFRNLLQGKPLFIIKNGVLQQNTMKKLRFTVNDVIDSLRQQGYFDIAAIENAIVETNGSLSVQLKAEEMPLTSKTLQQPSTAAYCPITIVADATAITDYFGNNHMDTAAIRQAVIASGTSLENIMLLTVDKSGQLYLIRKDGTQ